MSTGFSCSSCGAKLHAKPEFAENRVKCPKCGQVVQLPLAAEPHLAGKTPPRPAHPTQQPADTASQPADTASQPQSAGDLAYGPVTPKFAQLDAHEQHLYTFTLQSMFYTSFWSASPRYGWQPDYALFVVHLTDKRILVESHDFSAKEKLVWKGLHALAKFAVNKNPAGGFFAPAMHEEGELLKETLNKTPEWFAIDYAEIATVERQDFNNLIQDLGAKLVGSAMVKVSFQDPEREDLVFVAGAAKTRAFSFKGCYNKEFIAVTGQLLKEKARFQSEPQSKQSEKKEAVRKRQKAEEPARNPWIKTLGCLGHVLGIVLLFTGAVSGLGVLVVLGTIMMLVGWFVWSPWGKKRKVASAWRGANGN